MTTVARYKCARHAVPASAFDPGRPMNRGLGFLATILRRRRLVIGAAVLLVLAGLCAGLAARFDWQAAELEAAEQALRRHDCADARSRLDRYLARWPGDPTALLMATRAAWQTGAHAEAERFLSTCEAAGGQTDRSRLEWAMLGAHQGDFGDEESGLRALVERGHSEAPAILEALARGYQLARRFPEAMQALNALINYDSDRADLLVQRGTILRRLRGPHGMEPGEQDLRRAVALAPESATAHAALAGVLSDLGYV